MTNQEERNELFTNFLNRYYFSYFRKDPNIDDRYRTLEIFFKATCPSQCSYCYLIKNGKDLYPTNLQTEENLLKNLNILLDWYIKNKFSCDICLFTGEMICSGLAFKAWDIMLEKFGQPHNYYKPDTIIYAENMDFLHKKPELRPKVEEYIERFNAIGIYLMFSMSVDGKYMDENRSRPNRPDNFYSECCDFGSKHFYAFHPMVSAYNIEQWIDNYDWWHSDEVPTTLSDRIMMLEVRNNDWTLDKINSYLKFLNHVIEKEFEKMNYDKEAFAKRVMMADNYPGKGYDNIALPRILNAITENDRAGAPCSIAKNLCVRLGDLTIHPCHRLSYDKFMSGKMIIENNEIVGYESKNWEFLSSIYSWNRTTAPQCSDCDVRYWCGGPCFGANYEATKDPFWTDDSVCNLYKARIAFLFMKYDDMELFPYFESIIPNEDYLTLIKYKEKLQKRFESNGEWLKSIIVDAKISRTDAREVRS